MIFICQNGSFCGLNSVGSEKYEQLENVIHVAKCKGFPFRGKPMDMANKAINCFQNNIMLGVGSIPVILESRGGYDNYGNYTTEVVFQIVNPF